MMSMFFLSIPYILYNTYSVLYDANDCAQKKNTIIRKWSITRLIQLTTIQIISFKLITTKKIWENETKYSQKQNKKIAKWFLTSLGSDLCANRSNSYLAHFSWIRFWVNPFSLSILIYFSDYNLSSLIGIISLA